MSRADASYESLVWRNFGLFVTLGKLPLNGTMHYRCRGGVHMRQKFAISFCERSVTNVDPRHRRSLVRVSLKLRLSFRFRVTRRGIHGLLRP